MLREGRRDPPFCYAGVMAIKQIVMTCDWCEAVSDEDFVAMEEAREAGWYVVIGPAFGEDEKAFCSLECMESFLP